MRLIDADALDRDGWSATRTYPKDNCTMVYETKKLTDFPAADVPDTNVGDAISRQAAIDAVEHITSSMSVCVNSDECHGMKRMQRQAVIELANLPSAQPEQTKSWCINSWCINCKDCKHLLPNDRIAPNWWRICDIWRTGMNENEYCSRGEIKEE